MEAANCNRLRVAVISRFDLTRAGLIALVRRGPGRAVATGLDRQPGGGLVGHDVAIVDLASFTEANAEVLTRLLAAGIPVVALDSRAMSGLPRGPVPSQVAAVVPMNITASHLLDVLECAASGQTPGPEAATDQDRTAVQEQFRLTSRELDILQLVGAGLSNLEISKQLYLSINSVKSYIRTAYRKIGVQSRSQAVLWVVQHDLAPALDLAV